MTNVCDCRTVQIHRSTHLPACASWGPPLTRRVSDHAKRMYRQNPRLWIMASLVVWGLAFIGVALVIGV